LGLFQCRDVLVLQHRALILTSDLGARNAAIDSAAAGIAVDFEALPGLVGLAFVLAPADAAEERAAH
jgi:hypothetical protein